MGLRDDLETVKQEKANLLDRLQKLEEKREKVRPELYDKLRGELDSKNAAVDARAAELEAAIAEEERIAEELRREEERQAEERRLQEERLAEERRREEASRLSSQQKEEMAREAERRRAEKANVQRQAVLDKHADEIAGSRDEWRRKFDEKAREFAEYIETRKRTCEDLGLKIESQRLQIEELNLRKEIGEFDDDPNGFAEAHAPLAGEIEKCQAEITTLTAEIAAAEEQAAAFAQTAEPDFEAAILEKYAAEIAEAEPEEEEIYEPEAEEVYEPPAEGAAAGGAPLAADEEVVEEYEELYDDDAEEAFFTTTGRTTMNPCLIERKQNGRTQVYDLVTGGEKTFVGSREECAVFLPYPGVDAKHAWIKVDRKGQYLLKDLGSRGGVFVNGQRAKKTLLKNGDVLKFGNTELTLKLV